MFKIIRRRFVPAFTYHDSVSSSFKYKYHNNPCKKVVIDDMWFNLPFNYTQPPSDGLKFFLSDGLRVGYDDEQTIFYAPAAGYFSDLIRVYFMNEVWLYGEFRSARENYLHDQVHSVSRLLSDFTESDINAAIKRFQVLNR